jgi:hypothetical protein
LTSKRPPGNDPGAVPFCNGDKDNGRSIIWHYGLLARGSPACTTTDALDGRCGAVRIVNPELRNSLTGMRTRKPKLPPDGAGDTLPSSGGNGLMHGAAGTA